MISEWFISLAATFVEWLAEIFGDWEAPPEFEQAQTAVSDMFVGFASVGVWVNWSVLGVCVAAALLSWGIVLTIKLTRAVVAHVPVIGGSGD